MRMAPNKSLQPTPAHDAAELNRWTAQNDLCDDD